MKKLSLFLFLVLMAFSSAMAQRTISGTVVDVDGEPLIGANILVKGTTSGVITDFNGNFELQVDDSNSALIVSYTGYTTQEIPLGSASTYKITLQEDAILAKEVVVVGYTAEAKEKIISSISTVSSVEIEQVPIPNFEQILQGKAPGLTISTGSGQPGRDATKVRIRGNGSINNSNEPLYILDGVPIDPGLFEVLNPNDFASVSILKDAAAVSQYGSRGSNGVILINTKQGKVGTSTVTYRFQNGISTKTQDRFEMMNSAEKLAFERKVGRGPWSQLDPENPADQLLLDSLSAINVDWADEFIKNGNIQSHELLFQGGTDKTRYYASVNYLDQEGATLRSDLKRYGLRLNVDNVFSDKLTLGIKSYVGLSRINFTESENGIALANPFAAAYLANPYQQPRDEEGNILIGGGRTGPNALERLETTLNQSNNIKTNLSMNVTYRPLQRLKFTGRIGVDYDQINTNRFIDPEGQPGSFSQGGQGSLRQAFQRTFRKYGLAMAEYDFNIGERNELTASVAIERIESIFRSFSYTGYGIDSRLPNTPAGITAGADGNGFIPAVGGGRTQNALMSYFGTLAFSRDGKYNLKATLRRDGSSRFGQANRYATLWSVGAAWVISQESFMADGFFDDLKLRASYGTAGNQGGIGNFASLPTYGQVSYAGLQGQAPASPGNTNLKWEILTSLNIGIDFGFLKRVTGSIDVYNNITSDLFLTQQLSRTTGFGSLNINSGKMRNRGIELLLNVDVFQTKDWLVSVGGNIAYNQNEITDLGQVDEFEQGTSIVRVGLPLNSHYVVGWAGVNPANGEPLYYDLDGNITNVFTEDNNQAIFGTSEAPTVGGFNANVSYKAFDLGAFFTFMDGYTRFNNQTFFQENPNFAQFNLSTIMNEMWEEPGDITEVQSFLYQRQFSSKDLEDSSFLRFRNLTASYTISGNQIKNVFSNVRLYAQAQNLITWTKWTGFDPEDNNNIAGYEFPAARSYTVGLDITF